jgi:hypothetical protein
MNISLLTYVDFGETDSDYRALRNKAPGNSLEALPTLPEIWAVIP